jgi:peptide/nickel transport system permease protein
MLVIFQFKLLLNYFFLIIDYTGLLFSDASSALVFLNFKLIDVTISTLLFTLSVPLFLLFRKKLQILYVEISFSFAFIILLGFIFLFAPIFTNENPEFSTNLSVTRLKPPLSSIKQIELKPNAGQTLDKQELFRQKVNRIIKPSFNNEIIYIDSLRLSDKVIYFQKNVSHEIEKEQLNIQEGNIVIGEKIFLLGTDEFGRDLFSRLIYGTRISITVGSGAVVLSFFIGIILGFVAGYRGGFGDIVLNRFSEILLAFPVIYLIVLVLALFGSSIFSVILVLGISGWMSLFKIVKSEVLSIKAKEFFSTAELIGLTKHQLLFKEIFPVILGPVLVNLVFLFSNVVLAEAALSYLGLGTGNSYPSWGSMINSGQEYLTKAWWLIVFPGLGLILTLFSINSSGRILGRIFNPRMK